ncbi:MAG: hypothetical protein ACQETE_10955 [Bacteroidota bacterium]
MCVRSWTLNDCGQWAVGSGQWAVGSGQWAVGSWQLAVGSWQLAVGNVIGFLWMINCLSINYGNMGL